MTLDEAIKHCLEVVEENEAKAQKIGVQFLGTTKDREATDCRECAADHRQLAEWLTELNDSRAVQNEQEIFIHELMGELEEAKRLLKAAVEDLSCGGENNKCTKSCKTCTYNSIKGYGCRYFGEYHWRYAAEALALIGKDIDVPATEGDTNVGRKKEGEQNG